MTITNCPNCGGMHFGEHRCPMPAKAVEPCQACGGSGQTPVGEHFVTRDMALDAGEPAMEGLSMGVEFGPCDECGGGGLAP